MLIVDAAQLPLAAACVRHVRQAIDGLAHRLLNVLGLGEAAKLGLQGFEFALRWLQRPQLIELIAHQRPAVLGVGELEFQSSQGFFGLAGGAVGVGHTLAVGRWDAVGVKQAELHVAPGEPLVLILAVDVDQPFGEFPHHAQIHRDTVDEGPGAPIDPDDPA